MVTVTDTEASHGEDSGFSFITSGETCAALEAAALVISSADNSSGSDVTFSSHPADGDGSQASDVTFAAWPHDSDSGTSADSPFGVLPLVSSETGHGADTENETVHIYAFQPQFRWTGGGYMVRLHNARGDSRLIVVSGLKQAMSLLEGSWRHDGDSCRSSEEESRPSFGVSLQASPALKVSLSMSRSGRVLTGIR